MPIGVPEAEFVSNPEPRCPCVLLLDTSGSMEGEPINELNNGLLELKKQLDADNLARQRVEIAIVSFGGTPTVVTDFVTVDAFNPPTLGFGGRTPMGAAIEMGLKMLQDRKLEYKNAGVNYYRPWIFLITDGAPTDAWDQAAAQVRDGVNGKKFSFYAVGVQGADTSILSQISPVNVPPLTLNGLNFTELFKWLSVSLSQISKSKGGDQMVPLAPVTGWAATTS